MGLSVNIYNAVLFNIAWLLCVLGGNYVAIATATVVIYFHLTVVSSDRREFLLILQIAILGFLVDSLLIFSGALVPPGDEFSYPVWLACLWIVFATTLCHCLRWFQTHLVIAAVAGAVFGNLSYVAGTRMSDFSLAEPLWSSLLVHSVVWAFVFPVCLLLARRFQHDSKAIWGGLDG